MGWYGMGIILFENFELQSILLLTGFLGYKPRQVFSENSMRMGYKRIVKY